MTECTLHNLLTSCQYPQVFWIYQTNDYDENILLTKGTKQEMLEDDENNFTLLDHINDVVEYWTIREDGAMFIRLRMGERAKDLYSDSYVKRWDRFNPTKRPYLYSAEMDDFTNCIYGSSDYMHPYGDPLDRHHWADRKTEPSNSEKPNNCEHITEDGVTCAKYPACDDCLDNPLNKVKGSERLVKGSEKPNNCKVKNYCDDCLYTDTCDSKEFFYACTSKATISKMEQVDKDINVRSKDEPQTDCDKHCVQTEVGCEQTDCAWK